MRHIWLYSLGSDPDGAQQNLLHNILLASLGGDYFIEKWTPFSSQHKQSDDPSKAIVLLVGDWRKFTRMEYLAATNALALYTAGEVHLFAAINSHDDNLSTTANDPWQERYRLLWERLRNIPQAVQISPSSSLFDGFHQIASLIRNSPDLPPDSSKHPARLFFSYSHRDEALRDELAHHIKLLERTGLIESWHDRSIRPGDEWSTEIDTHLYTADLILLLLSSDFFASDYCSEIEAPIALERNNAHSARTIPVVLRPVVWSQSPIAALQALPRDARAITSWESRDSAYVNVCEGIVSSLVASKSNAIQQHPSHRSLATRKRIIDAALPSDVEVNRSAMLVVLIRKPASAGLRDLFSHDPTYDIEPEDVRSKPASIQFPISETTSKPESISATIFVTSPDFDPPTQKRTITLEPDEDSQPLIFMLAAKQSGPLKALVEIYKAEELIAACPLTTTARTTQSVSPSSPNVVSTSFDVVAGGSPANASGVALIKSDSSFATTAITRKLSYEVEPQKLEIEPREMAEQRREIETRESDRAQLIAKLRKHVDQANYEVALDLLDKELSEYPNDPELQSLHRQITDFYRMGTTMSYKGGAPAMSAPAASSAPPRTETYSPPSPQSAPPPPPYAAPSTISSRPAPKASKGRPLLILLGLILLAFALAFIFLSSSH